MKIKCVEVSEDNPCFTKDKVYLSEDNKTIKDDEGFKWYLSAYPFRGFEVLGNVFKKVEEGIDTASTGEYLATIARDAPIEDLTDLPTDHPDHPYQNGHTDETCQEDLPMIDETLAIRGDRYGPYEENSRLSQGMKNVLQTAKNYDIAPDWAKEAAAMVLQKLARAFNGDPLYYDNWHDIQGFAKLAEDLCHKKDA